MSSKLIKLDTWLDRNYSPEDKPDKVTVWRWCREGKLRAVKQGKYYYVREGEQYCENPYARRIEDETEKTQKQRSAG